ncbi:uroporphyrinogen decarboxylase family protein [Bacillus sp. B15-48]|uniref:uroporphyrinogen decarboxylase family protein n=1 Tax=Bacillus sp. B15-48 TaxID=1548601 RepID=UPI00193FC1AB|nr:uroporphyrinogen decarboxylase family protein [Bacillus sp. B15-48]MBM4761000.1 uroporphyrinogen-III decarboxylase [Bacillus sp. B15-48]
MGQWTKKERFEALLSGEKADRPTVSAWKHFLDKEQSAEDLATATIEFTNKYNWDWMKINPRATYLSEVWGNRFDFNDYEWVFPKQLSATINAPKEVWSIERQDVNSSAPLLEQLEAVRRIRQGLPDTPIIQTVFSPLTVLLFIAGRAFYVNQQLYGSEEKVSLEALFVDNRAGVHKALHAIALTMADYVSELDKAGIDGLFYAVTGTAHHKLFDLQQFNEFSRPYDLIVLEAARHKKNIMHTCGDYAKPELFNDYAIDGISWDTKAEGNADISASLKATKVGGVDHRYFNESDAAKIRLEAEVALTQMKDEPFMLAPNCAVPPNASEVALTEFKQTVK